MGENTVSQKSKDQMAKERTDLAAERTGMAAERSLMAWIRTGISMIAFGFTIYKLLTEINLQPGKVIEKIDTPLTIGLFLIGLGTFCIIPAIINYRSVMDRMFKHYGYKQTSFPVYVAVSVMVLGVFLFIGLIFRIKGLY